MSSSIHIRFRTPVELADWAEFCREAGFAYSPTTIGGNTFYAAPEPVSFLGRTIAVGKASIQLGGPDRSKGCTDPVSTLDVSSAAFSHLDLVAGAARAILERFPGTLSTAPELAHLVTDLPAHYDRDPYVLCDRLPTDGLDGWSKVNGTLSARVEAGHAVIAATGNGLHAVRIDGVLRASYVDLEDAMLEAGRMDWQFWDGDTPRVIDAEPGQRPLPRIP